MNVLTSKHRTLLNALAAVFALTAAPVAHAGVQRGAVAVSAPDATTFLLQYRDTLSATNWTDLARVAVTGGVTVATDTNAAPSRFYRALVP